MEVGNSVEMMLLSQEMHAVQEESGVVEHVGKALYLKMKVKSCPTLCNPMDCSLPGSSVHGILQAIILSGMPFLSPGDLPNPGIEPMSPALAGGFFTTATPGRPNSLAWQRF